MDLSKRHSGVPLTAREHEQRVNAARARWAAAATGAGALVGGNVAFSRHVLRQRPLEFARRLADARHQAEQTTVQEGAARAAKIRRAIQVRLRATRESAVERHRRVFGDGTPTGESGPPVIGNKHNLTEIYDYEIDRLQRRLTGEAAHLNRLESRERAAFEGGANPLTAEENRLLLAQRAQVADLQQQLRRLGKLRASAHARIVRAGYLRSGTTVPPAIARQFRGGETLKQMKARRDRAKAFERARRDTGLHAGGRQTEGLLPANARRTERLRVAHGDAAVAREAAAIHDSLLHGEFSRRLIRTTGRGALVGAGLGFTAAGLGILAHHFVTAIHRREPDANAAEKIERPGALAKAQRSRTQDSIAAGLARTYRAWIDRLLGRTDQPMQMGDDIGSAMAPGLATAYAQGAVNPPVDTAGSDPRWRIDVDFDRLNAAQRRHMVEYALDRIVEITQQQRDAIRAVLLNQTVLQGIGPPDVARSIRETIGLTAYQQDVVRSFRVQLQNLDVAALERKLRDRRYDSTLRRAIETNTPLSDEQIDAMVDAYNRKMIALRAVTIARTESIRATTQGALARAQEVLDQHPELDVIKIWHSTHDDRTRPTHVHLDGHQVQGMLTPFVTSTGHSIRWPVDDQAPADEAINCRCFLEYRFIPRRGQLVPVP